MHEKSPIEITPVANGWIVRRAYHNDRGVPSQADEYVCNDVKTLSFIVTNWAEGKLKNGE